MGRGTREGQHSYVDLRTPPERCLGRLEDAPKDGQAARGRGVEAAELGAREASECRHQGRLGWCVGATSAAVECSHCTCALSCGSRREVRGGPPPSSSSSAGAGGAARLGPLSRSRQPSLALAFGHHSRRLVLEKMSRVERGGELATLAQRLESASKGEQRVAGSALSASTQISVGQRKVWIESKRQERERTSAELKAKVWAGGEGKRRTRVSARRE